MSYSVDLKHIISKLNMPVETFADDFGLKYHDIIEIINGNKTAPDRVIGKLFRLYGIQIFLY